ncbi:MAG: hypothetical protein LBF97_01690 [Elusimicrobiota bacterium]|nr:hypothetical protein [Elusimicrobiota bacterium]
MCDKCELKAIYKILDGIPRTCPKCGAITEYKKEEEKKEINENHNDNV